MHKLTLRVVVVEDYDDTREALVEILEMMGYAVAASARTGREGCAAMLQHRPHAAVIDLGLPDMDGCDVARRIRRVTNDIALVALTGYGQENDRQRALAAGFDAYMLKPSDCDALDRQIRTLTEPIRTTVSRLH